MFPVKPKLGFHVAGIRRVQYSVALRAGLSGAVEIHAPHNQSAHEDY